MKVWKWMGFLVVVLEPQMLFAFHYPYAQWGIVERQNFVKREMKKASRQSSHFSTAIHVLLDKGVRKIVLNPTQKKYLFFQPFKKKWVPFEKKVTLFYSPQRGIILWEKKRLRAKNLMFKAIEDPFKYQGRHYPGILRIESTPGGFEVVNEVELETYLQATLQGEMIPSWNLEALKAQAVASRTYALFMINHPKSKRYHLENSILDQVYPGVDKLHPRVTLAVNQTRGRILSLDKGIPIKAFYHSRCGGKTESAAQIWSRPEQKMAYSVPCPYCQKNPYSWKISMPEKKMKELLNMPAYQGQLQIKPTRRSPSGRITQVRVEAEGKKMLLSLDKLRGLLGYSKIKSGFLSWQNSGKLLTFSGVGSGHGVGMCQWGAQHLARMGKKYTEILKHYYPRIQINELKAS